MTATMQSTAASDSADEYRAERDRFVGFAFAAADLLVEVGVDKRILYLAGAAKALTGREVRQLIGSPVRELFAETHRDLADHLLRKLRREHRLAPTVVSLARGRAPAISVVLNGCCLPEKGDALYLSISHALRPSVVDPAQQDGSTGLLAGPAFQAAAAAALSDAATTQRDLTLTLLELAGLDELRARHGDHTLSALLGEIGEFLSAHAMNGNRAGRLAANRFGVVQAGANAAKLQSGIERLSREHDRDGPGLSVTERALPLSPDGLTPADAEKALAYTLRRFAGGEALSIRSLTEGFRELVADTIDRMSKLRSSVSDRLTIVFQPVVDLTNRELHHCEVLSRFEGEQSPADMVQFAEGVGLVEELDLTVCQRALSCLDSATGNAELRLAVNLSGRSLGSDAFVAALQGLLKPRADRHRLLFEITETCAITDLPRAKRVIQELRGAGHQVCLDDFGAGAASFPYLQAFTLDFVKIDGAYISRMLETPRDETILKAMVTLCADLSAATIAEMIETEAQAERLARLGVRFGQGYLFGRPAAAPMAAGASRKTLPKTRLFARRKGFVESWG